MTTESIINISSGETLEVKADTLNWKKYQLILFRIAFIFFVLMCIPLSGRYYTTLFSLDWFDLGYRNITNIGRFSPNILSIDTESGRWGWASYADWALLLGVAIVGAGIWSFIERNRKNYNLLYYWLRVLVRYRVAVGMIEFGFVKVFLIQMPLPPIGTLHINLGDITAQKLFWLSVGIIPWYEVFLGFVEVTAGFLLFFRKTTFIGALLTVGASANIVYVNFAYDGGVHVYSTYFVLLGAFLLIQYLPDFWKLLIKEQDVTPVRYYPSFDSLAKRIPRFILKYGIMFLFVVVLSYLHVQNRLHNPFIKEPITPGLANTAGYYEVIEFNYNNQSIPYSPLDTLRWQDAVFEEYSTINFKVNKPIDLDLENGTPQPKDVNRNWELTGIAGGRQYYYYEADTVNKVLKLFNKHKTQKRSVGSNRNKEHDVAYTFQYEMPSESIIILNGVNNNNDSLSIILKKREPDYALIPLKD